MDESYDWASVSGGSWHRLIQPVTRESFLTRARHRAVCGVSVKPFNVSKDKPMGWLNICRRCENSRR